MPAALELDQRGMPRPQNGLCDMGAYERSAFALWARDCCLSLLLDLFTASEAVVALSGEFQQAMIAIKDPAGIQLGDLLIARSSAADALLRSVPLQQSPLAGRQLLAEAASIVDQLAMDVKNASGCCQSPGPAMLDRLGGAVADLQQAVARAPDATQRGDAASALHALRDSLESLDLSPGIEKILGRSVSGALASLQRADAAEALASVEAFIARAEPLARSRRYAGLAELAAAARKIRDLLLPAVH